LKNGKGIAIFTLMLVIPYLALPCLGMNSTYYQTQTNGVTFIEDAENAIGKAYAVIVQIENEGGNSSSLVAELNQAVELLNEAVRVYEVNQTKSEELAINAKTVAEQVYSEAVSTLTSLQYTNFIYKFILPIGVIFILVFLAILGYYIWRGYKHRRLEKMLEKSISKKRD